MERTIESRHAYSSQIGQFFTPGGGKLEGGSRGKLEGEFEGEEWEKWKMAVKV